MKTPTVAAAALVVLLGGCASIESPLDDGYQFGDGMATVDGALALQARYCAATDPRVRARRVLLLQMAGVPLPPSGVCTDILALDLPELDGDIEQAEEDQRRFEEILNESGDEQ